MKALPLGIRPLVRATGVIGSLLVGAVGAVAQQPATKAVEAPAIKGVVELFTSQGCSSCPPADALFVKLAKRPDLMVLTMPVDYWDYLGWKDTLASPEHTARQKAYAKARGDGQVYTPQAVINGQMHVNGAQEAQIENALRKAAIRPDTARLGLKGWLDKDSLVVETATGSSSGSPASQPSVQPGKGTVLLAFVKRELEVNIGRGENKGRKIVYANVVQHLKTIGEWSSGSNALRIPRSQLPREGYDFCAVLLQQGTSGPILAAAEVKMN